MPRAVKLGRKPVFDPKRLSGGTFPYGINHWAVQVDDDWYEIGANKTDTLSKKNIIKMSCGRYADSGAGRLGGELVGKTDKTDSEIMDWINRWIQTNPTYKVFATNCQKFAYEFMDWLTDGNFICQHRFNAADLDIDRGHKINTLAMAKGGNAIARVGSNESRGSYGVASGSMRALNLQAQAVAGPGFGAWGDASLLRAEISFGNVIGVHIEPNVNTGIGFRNGNFDGHVIGFGLKVGADGLEVNTPIGGVNACIMM